jgi:hypothetical protein
VKAGLSTGETPEINKVPPQEMVYQFQLAPFPRLPPEILRVEVLPRHIVEGEESE